MHLELFDADADADADVGEAEVWPWPDWHGNPVPGMRPAIVRVVPSG